MGVGADDRSDSAIEVPTHRYFFRRRLRVDIDEYHFGFELSKQLVGDAEGIVICCHEHSSLQVNHCVRDIFLLALIHTPAWQVRVIIGRAQEPARHAVLISVCILKVVDDLALIPDVVASSDDIDAELKQILS